MNSEREFVGQDTAVYFLKRVHAMERVQVAECVLVMERVHAIERACHGGF